jgi:hypothetical protein
MSSFSSCKERSLRHAAAAAAVFAAILFSSSPARAGAPDTASAAYNCRKGLDMIGRCSYDDALYFFGRAASAGMSKDSLCFFLAQVYLSKGDFDTALVFNYGIGAKDNTALAIGKYKQRRAIYSGLGWDKDAKAAEDSLNRYPSYRFRYLVPDVIGRLGTDYSSMVEKEQKSFPDPGPLSDNRYAGFGYVGGCNVRWTVPFVKSLAAQAGIDASVASMYYRSSTAIDSVNASCGFFAGILHANTGAALEYGMRRVVDYLGAYSTQNSISLSRSRKGVRWFSYMSGGYEIEVGASLATENRKTWLLGYLDESIGTGKGFSFLFVASGFFAQPVRQDARGYQVMYVNDVRAATVVHLRDSAGAMVPIERVFSSSATVKDYKIKSVPLLFDYKVFPQDQLQLNGGVSYFFPLRYRLTAGVSAGASCTYYPQRFEWSESWIADNEAIIDPATGMKRVAYSFKDGNYYGVKTLAPEADNIIDWSAFREEYSSAPLFVRHFVKRRVDVSPSLALSLRRDFGVFGSLRVKGEVAKNFSTIKKASIAGWTISDVEAPFSIPDRSWAVSLVWNYSFSRK